MPIKDFIKKHTGSYGTFKFYNGQVTLYYDPKNHKYLLLKADGSLEEQDGVTTVVGVIDKSQPLMGWAVKIMANQILYEMPFNSFDLTCNLSRDEFTKLVLDAKKAKDEHLEDAGTVGNAAHKWIEKYIKAGMEGESQWDNNPLPEEPRAYNCCQAMMDWANAHNVRFIHTEEKVYSRIWGYAGTMDGLATVDSCTDPKCCPNPFTDRLSIVDWKTSNHLNIEYIFQTAAYQHAWIEMKSVEDPHSKLVTDRWIIRLGKDEGEFEPWHFEWEHFEGDFEGFKQCLLLSRSIAKVNERVKAKETLETLERKMARNAAREAKAMQEAEERSRRRVERRKEREEALAKDCGNKKYKGKRPPQCKTNSGKPCLTCTERYGIFSVLANTPN